MEMSTAIEAFSSLSQDTRLRVFRLLIEYGRDGAFPGSLSEELDIPPNTLSFHLAHLSRAGLVTSERHGRSVAYFANPQMIEELIQYLRLNCCAREKTSNENPCTERNC